MLQFTSALCLDTPKYFQDKIVLALLQKLLHWFKLFASYIFLLLLLLFMFYIQFVTQITNDEIVFYYLNYRPILNQYYIWLLILKISKQLVMVM